MNLRDLFFAMGLGNSGGAVSPEQINQAVSDYLEENPVGVDLAMTGAAVGQIAKITAVDASGIPTAWEPVDMPSGGGSEEWELIESGSLVDVASVIKEFAEPYRKITVFMNTVVHAEGGQYVASVVNGACYININDYVYNMGSIGTTIHAWGLEWRWDITANGKFITVEAIEPVLSENAQVSNMSSARRFCSPFMGESINKVTITCGNETNLPKGGTYQIWGCK